MLFDYDVYMDGGVSQRRRLADLRISSPLTRPIAALRRPRINTRDISVRFSATQLCVPLVNDMDRASGPANLFVRDFIRFVVYVDVGSMFT